MSAHRAFSICVLLLSLALAACDGGGEEATPGGETPGASPAGGTVTIDLWHGETAGNLDQVLFRLADYYLKANPDSKEAKDLLRDCEERFPETPEAEKE